MVSLVFVAHSRALANALVELVRQVAPEDLRLAIAAGAGTGHQEFGTDAAEVAAAIQSVYSEEGVLVLMDLGSAVLSAELALELLPESVRTKTVLCPGALVEGAIAAAVQAGLGSDLESVAHEARNALQAKLEHLGAKPATSLAATPSVVAEQAVTVTLKNPHGLHIRPAAQFVLAAGAYTADIRVTNATKGKGPVSARSLNGLATLGAVQGDRLIITASGADAAQAMQELSRLVGSGFGETVAEETPGREERKAPASCASPTAGVITGIPVAEGIALGPLYLYQPQPPPLPNYKPEDPQAEWEKLRQALHQASLAIRQRRQRMAALVGETKAAIFDAHLLILEDPELLQVARQRITAGGLNAATAWHISLLEAAAQYEALDDPYQRARRADVIDAGNQVLCALTGQPLGSLIQLPGPAILAAEELTPAQVSQLDSSMVLGVITASGGATSHSAILCRSLGIPAITGVDLASLALPAGTQLALDGSSGLLWIEPDAAEQRRLAAQRQRWMDERRQLLRSSQQPVILRDGRRIEVAANVGSLPDARAAQLNGADGIGVLRTEFLYLRRTQPPSEEEQLDALLEICRQMGEKPVIVRTLDIGGDKALPYIPLPQDANPYLGVRAIRLSLRQPELFQVQLRAILRAGATHPVQVMFPMIATLEEILSAKEQLKAAHLSLQQERLPHAWPIPTGVMVEVPAAALLSQALAPQVDFFSIGTNDLTQYALAAERGNARLADYADALHPAVLRLIQMTVTAAHQRGKWAGVCGEVAAEPLAAPILAGLGVDELSMNPADIPRLKAILRSIDPERATVLAEKALNCSSAAEVRRLASEFLNR